MIRAALLACRALPLLLIAAMLTLGVISPAQAAPTVTAADETPSSESDDSGRSGDSGASGDEPAGGDDGPPVRGISPTAAANQVLTGLVYNESGKQLQNILVEELSSEDPTGEPVSSAFTYEEGYTLNVPAGDFVIRFSSPTWKERFVYQTAFYGGGAGEVVTVAEGDAARALDDVVLSRNLGVPVTGRIVGPDGVTGVADVEVQMYRFFDDQDYWGVYWTTTDENGSYTFPHAKVGSTYSIRAYGQWAYGDDEYLGYSNMWLGNAAGPSAATKFGIPAGSDGQSVADITLTRGVDVSGTVSHPDGALGDVYMNLLLVQPDGDFDYVGYDYLDESSGEFLFPRVTRGGTYTVEFYSYELGDHSYLGGGSSLEGAETFTLDGESPDTLELGDTMLGVETTRVTGSVLDTDGDGVPADIAVYRKVDGEWVFFDDRWSDYDGSYRTRLPWGSTWTLKVHPDSGDPVFLGNVATIGEATTFATGADVPSVELDDIVVAQQPQKVAGNVVDANGDPIANARVSLWNDSCGEADPCWNDWDFTRTNANGRYVFQYVDPEEGERWTVSASKENAGYSETFLGGGTDAATATPINVVDGVATQVDPLTLPLPDGLVRGTLSLEGGGSFDWAYVDLYKWDEGWQGFDYVDTQYLYDDEPEYVFTGLEPGTYTLFATAEEYDGETSYLGTWRSGTRPTAPDSPGTFLIDAETVFPVDGIDVQVLQGVELHGVVTRADGQPLKHAEVRAYEWEGADGTDYWNRANLGYDETDADGRYSITVPQNTAVYVHAYREGYQQYALGGDEYAPRSGDNSLDVGSEAREFNFDMAPFWGYADGPQVGDVAGVQDEDCLQRSVYFWDEEELTFDGLELSLEGGAIRRADQQENVGDPFGDSSRDPALVPLQDYSDATYGVLDNGSLCVLWNSWESVRQAILTPAEGPGFDVTYNYDFVGDYGNSHLLRAGHTDGEGPGDGVHAFAGHDSTGYADRRYDDEVFDYVDNTETGLVWNSLGSEQRGRYTFHFDGFEPRGAAPVNTSAPSISGTDLLIGDQLTLDPGAWSLDGEPAEGLEYRYTWHRVRGEDPGNSNTYTVTELDLGRRIYATVRAWSPGHDYQVVSTAKLQIPPGPPALTLVSPPVLDPDPVIEQEIGFAGPVWAEDPLPEDVTFSYQWFRNGNRIQGATGETYLIRPGDANDQLKVRVKASRPAHDVVRTFSEPVTVGDLPAIDMTTAPTLAGDPKVGTQLALDPGAWDAGDDEVTLSYRWSSDYFTRAPDEVGGGLLYTLKNGDAGRLVTAKVTATAPNHRSTTKSVTVGPIADVDATFSPLTVTVRSQSDQSPVPNAFVSVCPVDSWSCLDGDRSDANGEFKVTAEALTDYYVYVYPPPGSDFRSGTAELTTNGADLPTAVEVELFEPTPPPANVTIPTNNGSYDGVPSVYWNQDQTFNVSGCPGVANPTYTVTFSDGTPTQTGPMTEGPEGGNGLATYTAVIPAFYPSHGDTVVSFNVPASCDPEAPTTTSVLIYIDPSGVVTDQYGRPIVGATVTLQRSDDAGGPFVAVTDGDELIMDPGVNTTNPDLTDETGFFRWDVTEGWYRVKVDAAGCTSTTTPSMQVPPPAIDLLIKTQCSAPAPTATPEIAGTAKVGNTLTTATGIWSALTDVQVDVQWLRDGEPIPGATQTSYQLVGADRDRAISVRHTAVRETYVQEEGNGAPVSFTSVQATSAPTGATSAGDAPLASAKPTITGTPKVDQVLTAGTPTWDVADVLNSPQWERDGVAIQGETGNTYTVKPIDVGTAITVVYTGTKAGHLDGVSESDPVTGAKANAPVADTAASLAGSGKVDSVLTATAPTWSVGGVENVVTWYAGNDLIAGESGLTYTVEPGDVGTSITAKFTSSKAGYEEGSSTTAGKSATKADAPVADTAASLTGSGKVDDVLTATAPSWSVGGVQNVITWYADNDLIAGESGLTYTVKPVDVGTSITAKFTGTKAGYHDGSSTTVGQPATKADAPQATTDATLTGSGKVGENLNASAPLWNKVVEDSATWWRGDTLIEGAAGPTYEVRPADVGEEITIRFVGTKPGYEDGASVSNAITGVKGTAPDATSDALVLGSGMVDEELSVTEPTWNTSVDDETIQWFVGGEAVDGATGTTYVVQPGDVDAQVTAVYTATKDGYEDGVSTSNGVVAVYGAAPEAAAPVITGTPAVGQLLQVAAPEWSQPGVETTYRWRRDGVEIPGATGPAYTLTAADATREISVFFEGLRPGHLEGQVETAAVTVAKNTSATTAKLSSSKVKVGKVASMTVTVKVPGVASPLGKVSIKEGAKTLVTGTLKADKLGKVTIKLPKTLKKGKHTLVAVYAGTATVTGSKAKAVTLTVTK